MAAPKGHKKYGGGNPKGNITKKTIEKKAIIQLFNEKNIPREENYLDYLWRTDKAEWLKAYSILKEYYTPKLARIDNHNSNEIIVVTKVIHHKPGE